MGAAAQLRQCLMGRSPPTASTCLASVAPMPPDSTPSTMARSQNPLDISPPYRLFIFGLAPSLPSPPARLWQCPGASTTAYDHHHANLVEVIGPSPWPICPCPSHPSSLIAWPMGTLSPHPTPTATTAGSVFFPSNPSKPTGFESSPKAQTLNLVRI